MSCSYKPLTAPEVELGRLSLGYASYSSSGLFMTTLDLQVLNRLSRLAVYGVLNDSSVIWCYLVSILRLLLDLVVAVGSGSACR